MQNVIKNQPKAVLCYVYGQYQARGIQSPENIVGVIVKQLALAARSSELISNILDAYRTRKQGSRRELKQLIDMAVDGSYNLSSVYVFLDGLDEMTAETLRGLEALAKAFQKRKSGAFLHLVLSGRPYSVKACCPFSSWSYRPTIDVQAQREDVRAMVKEMLLRSPQMQLVADGDLSWQGRIISGITNKAMAQ